MGRSKTYDYSWLCAVTCFVGIAALPSLAYAGAMTGAICQVYYWVIGPIGSAAATMGIMSVGIAASLGKASVGMALTVAVGLSVLFSAVIFASYFGIASPC